MSSGIRFASPLWHGQQPLALSEPQFPICKMGLIKASSARVLFIVQWGDKQEVSDNVASAHILVTVIIALSPPWILLSSTVTS